MNNQDNNIDNNDFFSNISNIDIIDTPAESFDNLYGSSTNNINDNLNNSYELNENKLDNNVYNNQDIINDDIILDVDSNNTNMNNINNVNGFNNHNNVLNNINNDFSYNNVNNFNNNSNFDIDNDRMMSIEEQLSKTSQYNPEELLEQKINIPVDDQFEKNKFSYAFVIVLFAILGIVIMFLPQLTKLIK